MCKGSLLLHPGNIVSAVRICFKYNNLSNLHLVLLIESLFLLQSSVCLKLLVLDLVELLLLSAFPELDGVFNTLHQEKRKFGELKID
uniref:Phox (PX) domain-containing protein n=1 Tax=Solanum tuberosum TaxID=4113 RepID=M0ZRX6_SOLTU